MEETPKTPEQEPAGESISAELRELGRNLVEVLRSAWESEERKKVQDEIRSGLNDMGKTFNEAVTDFNQSTAGQRFRENAQEFQERIRSAQVDTKVRNELLNALRTVNVELEKASSKMSREAKSEPTPEPPMQTPPSPPPEPPVEPPVI